MEQKKRVLLQVDYLTNKVYDVKQYTGDGKGIDVTVDNLDYFVKAEERGMDVFYENNQFVERKKDPNEFYNRKSMIEKDIETLRAKEREAYVAYATNRYEQKRKCELIRITTEKRERLRELGKLIEARNGKIKAIVEREIEKTNFKYYCSVCMIIRDENEYLEEWLTWHIRQGIEHFYLYDHGSKQSVAEYIGTLDRKIQDKVTVIWFGGHHDFAQHDAYNLCLNQYRQESRWIGFIDSDEMIRVKNGESMPEFLKNYERYAALFIGWLVYNANGHRQKTKLSVRERFKTLSLIDNPSGMGKVFVQPFCMRQMLTHNGYAVEGFEIVDENGAKIEEGAAWMDGLSTDRICIDHYYTKSYEEWKEKIKRGTCDPYYRRKYDEFFAYNPELEDCREEIFPEQLYELY